MPSLSPIRVAASIAIVVSLFNARLLPADEIVLTTGERFDGKLVQIEQGDFLFETGAVQPQRVPFDQLVRYGHPPQRERRPVVNLTDGSQLVLAPLWVGRPSLLIDETNLTLRGNELREFTTTVDHLRSIASPEVTQKLKREAAKPATTDRLWLASGDRLTGEFRGVSGTDVVIDVDGESLPIAIDRIALVYLAEHTNRTTDKTLDVRRNVRFDVWLVDGTKLCCKEIEIDDKTARVTLASGAAVRLKSTESIACIVGYPKQLVYLSDLEAADYKQTPYFNIEWPYTRDENLSGEMLAAGNYRYAKGIAMHSAARLAYRLPANTERFVADVAIDDSANRNGAGQGGSVVFRVYVAREGELSLAYESPIIRSGETPLPVDIDVASSPLLVLLVDYAERGDQNDHADWLDARVVLGTE